MKLIGELITITTIACLPLAAEAVPSLSSGTNPLAASPQAGQAACDSKSCPDLDQHGHPPLSCYYKSSLATGFQCILICTYKDTNWGTRVAASNCH